MNRTHKPEVGGCCACARRGLDPIFVRHSRNRLVAITFSTFGEPSRRRSHTYAARIQHGWSTMRRISSVSRASSMGEKPDSVEDSARTMLHDSTRLGLQDLKAKTALQNGNHQHDSHSPLPLRQPFAWLSFFQPATRLAASTGGLARSRDGCWTRGVSSSRSP